jgi:hypothetical protein
MTRSTISPIRRVAAVAAIAGVTGLGAVALAPSAFAAPAPPPLKATTTPYTTVTGPNGQEWIVSPVPDKKIDVKIGKFHVKLEGWAAQAYQSVEANQDVLQGLNVWFDEHGVLMTGPQPCDPTLPVEVQPNCVSKGGPRF